MNSQRRYSVHIIRSVCCLLFLTGLIQGQIREVKYQSRDAWLMESRALQVIVMQSGGHIASLILKDGARINLLWAPERPTIEPTDFLPARHASLYGSGPGAKLMSGLLGHNLCFSFWGNPSESEFKAGMSTHGEAGVVRWTKVSTTEDARAMAMTLSAELPASSARFGRTLTMVSPVLYIEERAENLDALDRPVGWCEHVTVGAPFLKKGVTIFDASLTRGRESRDRSGEEFEWPAGQAEARIELRVMRDIERSRALNNFLVDPRREYGYFTAVNPVTPHDTHD